MQTALRSVFMSIPGVIFLLSYQKPASWDVFHSLIADRKVDIIQVSLEQPQSYWSHFEFSFGWLNLIEAFLLSYLAWYIFETNGSNIQSQPGDAFQNESTTLAFYIAAWIFYLQRIVSKSAPSFYDIPMLFFQLWVAINVQQKTAATLAYILLGITAWRVLYAISMSFVQGRQTKILQMLSA